MQFIRNLSALRRFRGKQKTVATIGAYDGLHVGHREILARVRQYSSAHDLKSVLMSFEPTPKEFFADTEPPARLMRFREKFLALAELGIDSFFCPRFDRHMASLGVDEFIERLLVDAMGVSHLIIGDDFRFASQRSGTVADLERAGREAGFTVEQVSSIAIDGVRVSSTVVRDAIARGDLARARKFLGHNYRMCGRVIVGKRLGRKLGYPTANIALHRRLSPVFGIFAVRVNGLGPEPLRGVASVGTRPTVDGVEPLLEVHIFNFDRDIYRHYIEVEFVEKIRDEEKFDSLDDLVIQMHDDAAIAKQILAA